ncbi:MAG TPA: TatD family deoxyribonuclease [Geobacter sp.]|nr:TatD family deoxyribonuclease [Geobacter sp.]HCE66350.1 TatD family deoxyribonuclease [Geobacter sp.]
MIDSHCHLDLEPLVSRLPRTLQEAASAGVTRFVVPGVHPDGWQRMSELAVQYPAILPAFGIHPMHAAMADQQTLEQLAQLAPHGVAIGEIGLDPAYSVSLEVQESAFRAQIGIALRLGLPLLIHCRRLFQRTLQLLREEHAEQVGGIMHAFSGSPEMAREFVRLGFAISISGTVTWTNAVKPLRVARELPLENLVMETDAPDMTPQSYRGRFNRPAWMAETAARVALERGVALETVIVVTAGNTRRVLRLPDSIANG